MSDDMQAWIEANKTNEHHQHLLKSVGEWKVAGKFWMAPGQPPMETSGTSTVTSILDDRFVKHDYSSHFGGEPFNGLGIDGYDNAKNKYVSIWIDSMSTGFSLFEGEREGNVTTAFGEMPGMDGGTRTVKSVSTYSDEKMIFSMYDKAGDDWTQTMELSYTRA